MDNLAQYFLKPSGRCFDHKTVRFGSGAGPNVSNVCKTRNEFLVTKGRPSIPTPPTDSVTHVGSPENKSLYSGVLINFTRRNFMMK